MKHVLACIDGSKSTTAVCDYASWAALRLETPLTLFHVLDENRYPSQPDMSGNIGLGSQETLLSQLAKLDEERNKLALKHGQNMLEAAKRRSRQQGINEVLLRQRHGDLASSLLDIENDIRLLVMGLHGVDSNETKHIGSQLETVIRTVQRPILVTPAEFRRPTSVMLAFDGSDTSRKGVKLLAESPIFKGMPIDLLMVSNDTAEAQASIEAAANHLREFRHNVRFEVRPGEIEPTLHAYQQEKNIDLVVMGAYGHSRIRRFLIGSTTTKMLQNTQTPLLLLR